MYLYNIMYAQDSINKVFNFIRTGQFELGTVKFGQIPQPVYIQQLSPATTTIVSGLNGGTSVTTNPTLTTTISSSTLTTISLYKIKIIITLYICQNNKHPINLT